MLSRPEVGLETKAVLAELVNTTEGPKITAEKQDQKLRPNDSKRDRKQVFRAIIRMLSAATE